MGASYRKNIQGSLHSWILRSFFAICLLVLIVHCKKGDTGPAGPAGNAGAAGPSGPQGPKGDTGTANVIYSPWLDVPYLPDTIHIGSVIDTLGFYADITAQKLSAAILSNGEMKVYLNFGTTTNPDVVPLPYFDVYTGININVDFKLQKISLYANADAGTRTVSGAKVLQYRYILVPGSVPARMAHPIDWKNYNQVKQLFGIQD